MSSDDTEMLIDISEYSLMITSFLTILTCPVLFFKYAKKGWKRTGFSMIFLLILSDFVYSLTILATVFYPDRRMNLVYRFALYFCSNFSIYWACAIAFLVYKTLTSQDPIHTNKLFSRTLIIVLALTLICVHFMNERNKEISISSIFAHTPLLCGVLLAVVFYLKSIKFLQSQSEFEKGSINLYIKSLKYYCLTQFALYLPSIIFILGISGIGASDSTTAEVTISILAESLASLSGFVNTLIFFKQGNVKEYQPPSQKQSLDFTIDSLNSTLNYY